MELAGDDRSEPPLLDARSGLRRSLLRQFDRARREWETQERPATFSHLQELAFSLLATGKLRDALDYTREPPQVRDAYGMTLFGQSCLAARRLVEAGTKFVTVIWAGVECRLLGYASQPLREAQGLSPPRVGPGVLGVGILDLEQRGMLDGDPGAGDQRARSHAHDRQEGRRRRPRPLVASPIRKSMPAVEWAKATSSRERTSCSAAMSVATAVSPKDILATAFYLLGHRPGHDGARPRRATPKDRRCRGAPSRAAWVT